MIVQGPVHMHAQFKPARAIRGLYTWSSKLRKWQNYKQQENITSTVKRLEKPAIVRL